MNYLICHCCIFAYFTEDSFESSAKTLPVYVYYNADSTGECRTLRTVQDGIGQCGAMWNIRRTVWDTAGQCRTLQESAGQFRTVQDSAGQCGTFAGRFGTLQDSVGHCRRVQDSSGRYRTVPTMREIGRTARDTAGLCRRV